MEMSFKCLVKGVLQDLDNILTFIRFESDPLTEALESGVSSNFFQIQVNFKYLLVVLHQTPALPGEQLGPTASFCLLQLK